MAQGMKWTQILFKNFILFFFGIGHKQQFSDLHKKIPWNFRALLLSILTTSRQGFSWVYFLKYWEMIFFVHLDHFPALGDNSLVHFSFLFFCLFFSFFLINSTYSNHIRLLFSVSFKYCHFMSCVSLCFGPLFQYFSGPWNVCDVTFVIFISKKKTKVVWSVPFLYLGR